MKVFAIIFVSLCVAQVALGWRVAAPRTDKEDEPITDDQADCIAEVLRAISVDTDHVGDQAGDIADTISRLLSQRQRCEDILSDPPTALEQRLHEACRLAWGASVTYELLRLRNQSQAVDFFNDLIDQVNACRQL